QIDPKQLSDSEWFKLAKDTGLLYVSLAIPVVMLAAYAGLLRAGGKWLVAIVMLVLPPSSRSNRYRLLTPEILEPLALTLEKSHFQLADLENKSSEFVFKYQSQKDERWHNFQESISKLTKNAPIYLGDFLLFLLFWVALFKLLPRAPWIEANEARF